MENFLSKFNQLFLHWFAEIFRFRLNILWPSELFAAWQARFAHQAMLEGDFARVECVASVTCGEARGDVAAGASVAYENRGDRFRREARWLQVIAPVAPSKPWRPRSRRLTMVYANGSSVILSKPGMN
jgi:hypothetical protein